MKIKIIENWPGFNRYSDKHVFDEGQFITFHKHTVDVVIRDIDSIEFWAN